MPEVIERSPLQQALLQHGIAPDLLSVCVEAINMGQMGANGEFHLFSRVLNLPGDKKLTVEDVITVYHLNSFIEWGGGEV